MMVAAGHAIRLRLPHIKKLIMRFFTSPLITPCTAGTLIYGTVIVAIITQSNCVMGSCGSDLLPQEKGAVFQDEVECAR